MHRQRTTRPHRTTTTTTTTTTDAAARERAADVMRLSRDDTGHDDPAFGNLAALGGGPADPSGGPTDLLQESIERHPSTVGQRLDIYLAAVARELEDHGVLTGSPQRTDPEHRLIGSIVVDCTTLRVGAWAPTDQQPADHQSLGGAIHPERPTPVIATWDEHEGWCVGLHHGPTHASRAYLHPDLLPDAQTVAEFVVGLALGQPLGATYPIDPSVPTRPPLRLVP